MTFDEARRKVHGWNNPLADGMSTPTISYRSPVKCIAFYKGDLVTDHVLDWIVELATYGYITEAGKNLLLIPIKLYEQARRDQQAKADEYARKRRKWDPGFKSGPASPSIKNWDCIPLTNFLPKSDSESKARLSESRVLSPLIPRLPEGAKRNAGTLVRIATKRNAICPMCRDSLGRKRSDAKYCSSACKQASHRAKGRTR